MLFADTEGVMKACFIKERIIPSQTQGLRLGMQLKGVIGVLLLIHPRECLKLYQLINYTLMLLNLRKY